MVTAFVMGILIYRRTILLALVIALIGGGVAYWYHLQSGTTSLTPFVVVQCNGKNAPLGMAWIPGGEFLMGSE